VAELLATPAAAPGRGGLPPPKLNRTESNRIESNRVGSNRTRLAAGSGNPGHGGDRPMANQTTAFEEASRGSRRSLASEFLLLLWHNKKWWMLPILLVLALLTVLVILSGSGAAPFIYTIF